MRLSFSLVAAAWMTLAAAGPASADRLELNELRYHELTGSAEEGWTATLVIEKQTFTLR